MTVPPIIDPALPWHEQIDRAEPDLLRSMMKMFVQSIMAAEADGARVSSAPPGRASCRGRCRRGVEVLET